MFYARMCMFMYVNSFQVLFSSSFKLQKENLAQVHNGKDRFCVFQVKFPLSQAGGLESSMMNHRAKTMDRKY